MTKTVWVVAALIACNGDKDKVGDGEIGNVSFSAGAIVGTGTVAFETELSGDAHVESSLDDGATWIASGAVPAAAGEVPVVGLRVASTHRLRVVVEDGGDSAASEPIEVDIDPPPTGTAPFALSVWRPEGSCLDGGYTLLSTLSQGGSGMGVIDRDGKFVWVLPNETPDTLVGRIRPGRDGTSMMWNVAHDQRTDDLAYAFQSPMDGSSREDTRTLNGHHDFVELPDETTVAWLGYEFRDLDLPDLGTTDPDPVAADVIYEIQKGNADAEARIEVFNTYDTWPGGVMLSGPEMEKCPTVEDAAPGFIPGYCEFSHANSLGYLPEDDAYFVMYRWLDTLVKVDRASGELVWSFGGVHNDFEGNLDDLFIHGHFSEVWKDADGLHFLIVDNHDADDPDFQENSRFSEYVLDESAMTFERAWSWQSDKFESILGDVRRMPVDGCDNVLVSLSKQGRVIELTRDGEVVWDVGLPLGNIVSRVHFLPTLYDFGDYAYWNQ